MRNILLALTTGVALSGTTLLAAAGTPDERQPEARAYVSFAFGSTAPASESMFYGLRLDMATPDEAGERPALMALEFNPRGFASASVNGVPFVRQLQLNQAGETQWTAIDWGLLAAGVVGLGFAVAEVAGSEDESPDPASDSTGGDTGGDDGGDDGGGTCLPGTPLCLPFDAGYGVPGTAASVPDLDDGTGYMGDLVAQ